MEDKYRTIVGLSVFVGIVFGLPAWGVYLCWDHFGWPWFLAAVAVSLGVGFLGWLLAAVIGENALESMVPGLIFFSLALIALPKLHELRRKFHEGAAIGGVRSVRWALSGKYKPVWPENLILPYHDPSTAVARGLTDAGGWVTSEKPAPEAWVNCTHTDSKGRAWTSY